jgi:hypothetical protein
MKRIQDSERLIGTWVIAKDKGSYDKCWSGSFREMYGELVKMLSDRDLRTLPSPQEVYENRGWHNDSIAFYLHESNVPLPYAIQAQRLSIISAVIRRRQLAQR